MLSRILAPAPCAQQAGTRRRSGLALALPGVKSGARAAQAPRRSRQRSRVARSSDTSSAREPGCIADLEIAGIVPARACRRCRRCGSPTTGVPRGDRLDDDVGAAFHERRVDEQVRLA